MEVWKKYGDTNHHTHTDVVAIDESKVALKLRREGDEFSNLLLAAELLTSG